MGKNQIQSFTESVWNKIIDEIEQKKDITQDDICMLGVLLVLQLMRMPEVMKFTSEWLFDKLASIGNPLTQNEADRYMKLASFVWGDVKPDTHWVLNVLLENILAGKNVVIYHSDSHFILNGSRPVLCLKFFETDSKRENPFSIKLISSSEITPVSSLISYKLFFRHIS